MTPRLRQFGSTVLLLDDNDRTVANFSATGGGDNVGRVAVAADYTVKGNEDIVAVTSTAAARTITLPAASSIQPGNQILVVKDESGAAATNNITITRAGADTIDGAATKVINANYGSVRLYSDGVSKWFAC